MATTTAALDILFVTDEATEPSSAQRFGFDDSTVTVTSVDTDTDLTDRLASQSIDCVCLAGVDPQQCRRLVSTLRESDDDLPILVFTGDGDGETASATLAAGATDVVQSAFGATPPVLVRRRVEGVIEERDVRSIRETERRESEQELKWYREIVEATHDTAAVFDEHGRFAVANSRLADLYGTTPEELRGQPSKMLAELRAREAGDPFADLVAGHHEEYRVQLELDYPGQENRVTDVRLSRLADDGEFAGVVAIGRDITERTERERKIAQQRDDLARLVRLNAVIRDVDQALVGATTREDIEAAVCDRLSDTGRYRSAIALRAESEDTLVPAAWTDPAEDIIESVLPLGEDTAASSPALRAHETGETAVVDDVSDLGADVSWRDPVRDAGVDSIAAVPVVYGDRTYGVVTVFAEDPHGFGGQELAVLDELGETIGHAIAAVERREREETLTGLYEATRDLLGVETEQDVADVVVDVATDVLDLPEVGIFLFDDEKNVLWPASATEELVAFYGGADTFGPGLDDSETWHAYMTGETKVFDDISESERVANPDTEARSTFVRPLGEHGVFVAASSEVGVFDGYRRKLLGLLAATSETALDRVAGQADIREREEQLQARTRRLDRLSNLTDLFRDIVGALVRATSREGIEQSVCECFTTQENVAFAWVGTLPPDGDAVEPRKWTGDDGSYLDEVSLALDGDEPAARTLASGAVTVVSNATDHLRDQDWAREATDHGYQSVAAVPLVYGETTYGVAVAYATAPDAFEETTAVLAKLGELVGFAINAVETKQGVLADRVTELELWVPASNDVVHRVARLADEPVQFLDVTPATDERVTLLFALEEADPADVLDLESAFVGVESIEHVGSGGRHIFRATVTGRTVATTLLDCGGLPQDITTTPDGTEAVVTLPAQMDVRLFVDRVRETYPEVELVSRRDRHRRDRHDVRESVEMALTDRQREVLTTAYESGFFESPRDTTGAELADLLGVSQPTITHHLREGQRRVFEILFDDDQ